jgi:hypothetical protein
MWPAISIQSNENVRSAIVNCVCPNAAGPLNFTPTSSDVWGDVENSGEQFGKAQSATPRNQGQDKYRRIRKTRR